MLDDLSASELNSIIDFVLRKTGTEMEETLRAELQIEDLIATGRGLNSIESQVDANTLSVMGEDYLLKVDEGQPAGTVANLDSLIEWATARGLAPAENIESFAAGVQQAIYKRGTIKRFGYEGANFLEYVLNEHLPSMASELEMQISSAIEKAIAKNINKNNK